MDVVRHNHIPNQTKTHLVADPSQLLYEDVSGTRRLQKRQSPVTTERQKVQMFLPVIPLQPARHRSNPRPRYQKSEPGAPSAPSTPPRFVKVVSSPRSPMPTKFTNSNSGHPPGPSALSPNSAITVNAVGAYFSNNFIGMANSTDNGKISGGTPGARVFILLHELGHTTGALAKDRDDPSGGRLNNTNLERNCGQTIRAAQHQ